MTYSIKTILLHVLMVFFIFSPPDLSADAIPSHLASMAAQLYKGVEQKLKGKNLSAEQQKALAESAKILRSIGVHRWSVKPPKIIGGIKEIAEILKLDPRQDKHIERLNDFINQRAKTGTENALRQFAKKTKQEFSDDDRNALVADIDKAIGTAMEKLEKNYVTEPEDGRSIQIKWNPDSGKFHIKVIDDGSGNGEQFATALAGDIKSIINKNAEGMSIRVSPSKNPVNVLVAADIKNLEKNLIGKWKAKDGTVFEFSEGNKLKGEINPSREFFDQQIEKAKERIKAVKKAKIFEWQNSETKEVIQQKKFRRLKEPFNYLGEKYAFENAEEEIAKHKKQIDMLMIERNRVNLLPKDKHDPTGFKDVASSGGHPITITVTLTNGHIYTYDDAVFDGRRICAKRTCRVVPDLPNQKLPDIIKRQLVNGDWYPPGWLELDASIDAETGELILDGLQWSMRVTYSSYLGDPPIVDSIHTPYSWDVTLNNMETPDISLKFLVKKGDGFIAAPPEGIKELESDITVRIKLIYDSDPMKESETITIKSKNAEDEIQILARQTQDPKIFLSEPFILSPEEFINE